MSWIWLDGVEAFEKGKRVRAWKKWEAQFPASYLIEFIAQAGGVLLGGESDFENDIVFIKIEKVEFFAQPEAGERVEIEVVPEGIRSEGGWFVGKIFQDGRKILEGKVLLMNVGRLKPETAGPITFPRQLIESLKVS